LAGQEIDAEGGCYCGAVRYRVSGTPLFKGQCHCRECQRISGGSPNVVLGMPESGYEVTQGEPKTFHRADLDQPVGRDFCPECGTHLLARSPALPGAVLLKVGTLDDPAVFGMPQMAIFTAEAQPFHRVPEGVQCFERTPGG